MCIHLETKTPLRSGLYRSWRKHCGSGGRSWITHYLAYPTKALRTLLPSYWLLKAGRPTPLLLSGSSVRTQTLLIVRILFLITMWMEGLKNEYASRQVPGSWKAVTPVAPVSFLTSSWDGNGSPVRFLFSVFLSESRGHQTSCFLLFQAFWRPRETLSFFV